MEGVSVGGRVISLSIGVKFIWVNALDGFFCSRWFWVSFFKFEFLLFC